MAKKTTLYLGLNDRITKRQEISTKQAYKTTQDIIFKSGVSGCTFYLTNGMYRDNSGDIVTEETLKIELIGIKRTYIKRIANSLKIALNQESVLMQIEGISKRVV